MIYGLIGERLGHSYSKEIHNELGQGAYEHYELTPERVEAFVKRPDIKGLNVTIPYKLTVMPFCHTLSESAGRIGSVNTLVYDEAGKLHGYNTDYDGFLYMVKRAGISVKGKKVMILGTGGTSLTAGAAVRDLGAGQIVIVSRSGTSKATGSSEVEYGGVPHRVQIVGYDSLEKHFDSQIIVNTTPVGMYPNTPESLISLSDFPGCSGVVDVVYNPRRTKLVHEALELGIPATDGLPMLVAQAKVAEELFTGKKISDRVLEQIINKLRRTRENIVIVGMPGSGKTSIGTAVGKKLGREFVDIDVVIQSREGVSIPEIFARGGEAEFRRLESAMIAEQGKRNGIVIATGGGAVLDEKNYLPLKQNGRIFRIERRLEELSTQGRPLSKSLESLREMYEVRLPRYQRFAEETIDNETTIDQAAEKIIAIAKT